MAARCGICRVSAFRPELEAIVRVLLAQSADGSSLTLDQVGEAIGVAAVSSEDIEVVLSALEHAGRRVVSGSGASEPRHADEPARGERLLAKTLEAARALASERGVRPRALEIAERAGLSLAEVEHALALVRVMQR
jgi:hypothetical protein